MVKDTDETTNPPIVAANAVSSPFLRWAGGKRSLRTLILDSLPGDFLPTENRYFEPFIGGGAVMFATEPIVPGCNVVINDSNRELVLTYTAIRDNVDDVIANLRTYAGKNNRIDYNAERARHLTVSDDELPAWFIFMNKTSFNGIWRVNSTGQYNVPWGQLKNPLVVDEPTLRAAARRLQDLTIRQGSYVDAIADTQAGDVVYFDPPYLPLNATSFAKYTKEDFTFAHQRELADIIANLTSNGVRVILSNAYTAVPDPESQTSEGLTTSIFGHVLDLREVLVARSVGASAHTRVKAKEVLGFNYDIPPLVNASLPHIAGLDTHPEKQHSPYLRRGERNRASGVPTQYQGV